MSKHLGPLLKIDNSGIRWYRKVSNVGAAAISVGTLCEFHMGAKAAHWLSANKGLSADFNLVRGVSGGTGGAGCSGMLAGVAIQNINAYRAIRDTGLPTGWVQFKGPCPVSSTCIISAGAVVIASSSTNASHNGFVMMAGDGVGDDTRTGLSAGIGIAIETCNTNDGPTDTGNGWAWVYLNLP